MDEDKQWASKYLLDPLTAPEPSQETGPGSHFTSPQKPKRNSPNSYPTPPSSASPSRSTFHQSNPYSPTHGSPTHRQEAFGGYPRGNSPHHQRTRDGPSSNQAGDASGKPRRRGSSLGQRYPGDMSNRPLDIIRKEAKAADRSPHLRKTHIPGADMIDTLDGSIGAWHHEGPYDATLLARNTSFQSSPIEAVRGTNAEALKATPREMVRDSLNKHVPLQGTAVIPPGQEDMFGRRLDYEEGADLMREDDAPGGAYKRWGHVNYLPGDMKGKGEPSYSIEKALKDHDDSSRSHRRVFSDGNSGYEMQSQPGYHQRSASGNGRELNRKPVGLAASSSADGDLRRSNTTGRSISDGLKRRFGSLRRKKNIEA